MTGSTLKKVLYMKLPGWLLPIIATAIIGLLSTGVVWAIHNNEKTNSTITRCDNLNSLLIDHKSSNNSDFVHIEKNLDKIQEQLEKMNDKLDKLRDLK
jgi:peptidoglycan hydrolase CwlO-like protein